VPIRILHIGLGPIGAAIVQQVSRRGDLVVAGGVDVDPAMAGRDIGDVVGLRRRFNVMVRPDLAGAVKAARPDVAILSTSSSIKAVMPLLEIVLKAKVPVVSMTEELAYPVKAHAAVAKRIDALAAQR